MRKPKTLGELKESGYRVLSVKEEMRKNLIEKMRRNETLFPGIVGYENTVLPQIENAILAGQDIIFLGERGQAKTRIIRSLIYLLDEEIPVVQGCEINDNPYQPICKSCRLLLQEQGDDTPIDWLPREARFGEKLATPDVTTADLIGEIDPVKVAEGRYLSDELTIHYGLIPRTNRGIFAINELPDLAERIQVALFNIMEERDLQIRGFKVRLPLDVYVVASANPEDYTNRGRIITPLKDRYGAQIRTHYPLNIQDEIRIMEQERKRFVDDGYKIMVPKFMKEIIAEVTNSARRSGEINQRSGVSVRMSITNYETMISNALRRAIRLGEKEVAPRISDLPAIFSSTLGKIELESMEEGREQPLVEELLRRAVRRVFNRYLTVDMFQPFLERFQRGTRLEVSDMMPTKEYSRLVSEYSELMDGIVALGSFDSPAVVASGVEFILEGLHVNECLNKDIVEGKPVYRR
ncbi:MAG: magnesium chelatase [Nitrospinota bacterium]|nr:MAG: magnesium chelatase [Nitrospinota bacterium]